jgi:hypothetical protein
MADVKFDGNVVTVEGDTNFLTTHGGNSHLGYGSDGSAYLSYGARGVLVVRTFDGASYSDKVQVAASGQVDLFNGKAGNTHFGYGARSDTFLSFGAGGLLVVRAFDGASYREVVQVSRAGVTINGAVAMPDGATVSGKSVATVLDSLTSEINALKARVAALESR